MSDVAAAIRAKLEREYENEACYGGCGTEDCRCTVTGFDEMKAALLALVDAADADSEWVLHCIAGPLAVDDA